MAVKDGAAHLRALDKDREVYLDGERIARVADHPAFANSCRSAAALYDFQAAPGNVERILDVQHEPVRPVIINHRFVSLGGAGHSGFRRRRRHTIRRRQAVSISDGESRRTDSRILRYRNHHQLRFGPI